MTPILRTEKNILLCCRLCLLKLRCFCDTEQSPIIKLRMFKVLSWLGKQNYVGNVSPNARFLNTALFSYLFTIFRCLFTIFRINLIHSTTFWLYQHVVKNCIVSELKPFEIANFDLGHSVSYLFMTKKPFEKTKHLTLVSITTKLRFLNESHSRKLCSLHVEAVILRLLIVPYTGRSSSADTTVTTSLRVASSLPEMASLTVSCSSLPPLVS